MVGSDRSWAATRLILAVLLCGTSSLVVSWCVLRSPWGTLVIIGDGLTPAGALVPLLAGLLVGALQASAFGWRVPVLTVPILGTAVGLTVVFVFPALMHTVGNLIGAGLVAMRQRAVQRERSSGAVLMLLTVSVAAALLSAWWMS